MANIKDKQFASNIAYKLKITYSHTSALLTELEKLGLVTFSIVGRTKQVFLTEKGKNFQKHIKECLKIINPEEAENEK